MKLYINGCSFTAGEAYKFRPFWPSFFEQDHEIVQNDSYPGCSNHRIIRRTIDFINTQDNPEELVYVVQLTNYERSEWFDEGKNIWIGRLRDMAVYDDKWRDRPWASDAGHHNDAKPYKDLQKQYFSVAHTQESLEKSMLDTMAQVILLQSVFKQNNIDKYVIIPMSETADPRNHTPNDTNATYYNEMLNTIDLTHFTDDVISKIAKGLEVSMENFHPNRAGHETIYRYILNVLKERTYD